MTKERFVELVMELNEKQVLELISGINEVTHEWGWNENLEDTNLVQECWNVH